MKCFGVILLIGLVAAGPVAKRDVTSDEDEDLTITKDFFPDSLAIYTSEHDIVNIILPLNDLNDDAEIDDDVNEDIKSFIFFVEADKIDGKVVNKGLYTLKSKKAVKILDNGVDVASPLSNGTGNVYIAATDGIYTYDSVQKKAVKYGAVTDSIVSIAKPKGDDGDIIYVVNDKKKLFKITDNGNKQTPVDEVQNVVEIVMDMSDNLYYYGDDKQVYVLNKNGARKIEGLPKNANFIKLLRPPAMTEESVPLILDDQTYSIYPNGTAETANIKLETRPTAYSLEGTLVQYYAYNKKIYEYNFLALLLSHVFEEMHNFLEDKKSQIQGMVSESRSLLAAAR